MAEIFVNYRTGDETFAAVLVDELRVARFGRDLVFRDTRSIGLGKEFRSKLWDSLAASSVLLVIIGERWLTLESGGVRRLDMKVRDVEAQYATTVVLGYVRPTGDGAEVRLVRVGDTSAWVLHRGQYWPMLDEKGGGAFISGAVAPLPRVPDEPRTAEFDLPADGVLLVGTDGFGDPLGDGTGLVGKLFADVLAVPPSPLGFAHTLDFSRETFDDDRTLLAVWPAPKVIRP